MALKKTHTDNQDHVDSDAYHRLSRLDLDYEKGEGTLVVQIYKDEAARDADKSPAGVESYRLLDDGPGSGVFTDAFGPAAQDVLDVNPQEAGYEYLKNLPAYSGAVDV